MTKKRSPSGPTGDSPEAKKQDSKATPPRQGIRERQGADDSNKVQIKIYATIGDGNCFFHAVFGNSTNSDHYKTDNAQNMRQEWYNFLKQFDSLEDQNMPNELRDRLEKIFSAQDLWDNYQTASPINKSVIYRKYLQDIQHNSHYVMFEEIPIIASLAKIQVILNVGHTLDIINPNIELLGNYNTNQTLWGNKKEAIIYHQGIHFSHAEISNGDQLHDIKAIQGMEVHVIKESEPSNSGSNVNAKSDLKCSIDDLLNKLFGIEISDNPYANVTINDEYGNSQITVYRPQIIGKSVAKMHDVTSYMVISKALRSQIKDVVAVGKAFTLNNFLDYVLAISEQIQGVCLTKDEYNDVKRILSENEKKLLLRDDKEFYDLSIPTKKDNLNVTQYLTTNKSIIDKLHNLNQKEIQKLNLQNYNANTAKKDYIMQIQRYIKYVFSDLKPKILYSIDASELTAKFIASIFDSEGYLVEKNNVLFKQIRFYGVVQKAKKDDEKFKILSSKDTVEYITLRQEGMITGDTKGPFIRIIDDKKAIVKQSVQALYTIEKLINDSLYQDNNDETNNLLSTYNTHYNFDIDDLIYECSTSNVELENYNKSLSQDNLHQTFHYHAAKALYYTCDFQSLGQGNRVLVPMHVDNANSKTIRAYHEIGTEIKDYFIIDKPNIQSGKLITQIIAHISILLSPFASLRSHDSLTNDEEQLSPIQKIFRAFCELLQADYNSSDVLDQAWSDDLKYQFDTKIINGLKGMDLLGHDVQQYDLDFS